MSETSIPRPGQKANYLTLLVGNAKQQVRVRVQDKGIIIGRNTKRASVDFDTQPYNGATLGVSREHLLIVPKKDYFYAQDLETINSTWHNKVRMKPMVAEELYHGDLFHLGGLRVEIFYTYDDEIQENLGATVTFDSNASSPETSDVPEANKATRVFGEAKTGDAKDKTGILTDNLD